MQYVIAIHLMKWLTIVYDFRFKSTPTAAIGIHPTKAWLSQLVNFKNAIWHMNRASVFEWHTRFKEGTESLRDDERCGRSKEVNTPELIDLRVRLEWELLCWDFKGVQEEIPSEEASTLQIGSVAFPPGQYTSPQLHPCHRLFDQDGYQDSFSASLSSRPCSLWILVIP